jgi:hypothetical protein
VVDRLWQYVTNEFGKEKVTLDMLPNLAMTDKENVLICNPVSGSIFAVAQNTGMGSDVLDYILRQLGVPRFFAPLSSAVDFLVGFVLEFGRPPHVVRVDAPKVAVSAVVSGVHSVHRRRAFQSFENDAGYLLDLAVNANDGASKEVLGKRPNEALPFRNGIGNAVKILMRNASAGALLVKRVSVSLEGGIVLRAITLGVRHLITVCNYTLHVNLRGLATRDIAWELTESNNNAR